MRLITPSRRAIAVAIAVTVLVPLLFACAPAADPVADDRPPEHAVELAQRLLIVDTHIDVPYRLRNRYEDISQRTESGDFDYPRAKAGGLNAAFMSIYVPAEYQETGGAKEVADELIDMVEGFATQWPDKYAVARSTADVERHFAAGLVSLPMGMENGAPIEGDLENLRHFAARGIRYITLTHSQNNHISDSSYAEDRKWQGLSPFGREVVREMNRLGVMIDVSHVSDDAFYQALETTTQPVIASHSSCRHFTPGFERNMSDEMIVALAENGGVIQINFGSGFLTAAANEYSMAAWKAIGEYAEEHDLDSDDPRLEEFGRAYRRDHPFPLATLDDVVAHVQHVVDLVGVDHVGLGSDFDGVGPTLPVGLEDASTFPNLVAALLERGYDEADVAKILGGNLMRVWKAVEAGADPVDQDST